MFERLNRRRREQVRRATERIGRGRRVGDESPNSAATEADYIASEQERLRSPHALADRCNYWYRGEQCPAPKRYGRRCAIHQLAPERHGYDARDAYETGVVDAPLVELVELVDKDGNLTCAGFRYLTEGAEFDGPGDNWGAW